MAKKNSAGSGLLIGVALIIGLIASIPKEVWITLAILVVVVLVFIQYQKTKGDVQNQSTPSQNPTTAPTQPIRSQGKAVSRNDATHPDVLVSVTLSGMHGNDEYSIPRPSTDIPAKWHWVPPGTAFEIAGFSLPGMLYVGTGLRSGYYDTDPALINPNLKVAAYAVDVSAPLTDYWPSYSNISPEARKAYLQWQSDGRSNPAASIGYVFLFFYGLERRVLLDAPNEASAKAEIPAIKAEVERLLDVYGNDHSFQRYASQFLSFIASDAIEERVYFSPPPTISAPVWELPMLFRISLGQLAVDRKPVPADWALAWALIDPNITRRTPVSRCADLFSTLFKQRYNALYGEGFLLKVNRTKLKVSYMPASAGLRHQDFSRAIGELPDVTAVKTPITKLQDLVNECTTALDPYSRYIGRNPDKKDALEGLLQLPVMLWPASVRAELDDLKARVGDGMILMSFGELSGRLKSAGGLTRDKILGLVRALENLHLGMEPDILAGARTPKPEDKIALFATHPEDGSVRVGPAYSAAAITLDLACIAALADGEASAHELLQITRYIDSWAHLTEAHRKRLKAHLRLGIEQPTTLASLKRKLEPLPINTKHSISRFLAHLVQADGKVTPEEVKFLERVYKMLGIETQQVYSDLHVQAVTGTPAEKISTSPSQSAGFTLDAERIAQLQKETEAVSALLANVFVDDSPVEVSVASDVPEDEPAVEPGILGLDIDHSAFLRRLVARLVWARAELADVAADMELMLDGALEYINEIMLDSFDAPLTEGDDPVEINQELLEKLPL